MGAVVLFDGICNFCDRSVNFLIARDREGYFTFAPLQSEAGKRLTEAYGLTIADALNGTHRDAEAIDSVILVENGRIFTHSAAALRIAKRLGFPWNVASIFLILPPILRDAGYKLFARNRYRFFGKKDACMLPSPEVRSRFLE